MNMEKLPSGMGYPKETGREPLKEHEVKSYEMPTRSPGFYAEKPGTKDDLSELGMDFDPTEAELEAALGGLESAGQQIEGGRLYDAVPDLSDQEIDAALSGITEDAKKDAFERQVKKDESWN